MSGTAFHRNRSAALFGNSAMLGVVLAVAELTPAPEDFVTVRAIASRTGMSDSVVRPVMLRLAAAEMVQPLPKASGRRGPQYYQVVPGEVWSSLVRLSHSLHGHPVGSSGVSKAVPAER